MTPSARFVAGLVLSALAFEAAGQDARPTSTSPRGTAGVVCHVKVLSDKVPDVSSLEAWKKAFIKDKMTDEEKALAVWKSIWMFQHQDAPPAEGLTHEGTVQDALKIFNVYGYSFCGIASGHTGTFNRLLGLPVRGRILNGHSVPEVFWDNAWHLLDASLINYFRKADGKIASVDEISDAVCGWLEKNPGYKGQNDKLVEFHRADSWTGWKRGPSLLTNAPTIDAGGWWPARTHGWYATMQEYDRSATGFYEYGYSQGYQLNIQLRPGERLTRNWSNKGLHVNMKDHEAPGAMTMKFTEEFPYSARAGDLGPGRVGNGTLEYDVPVSSAAYRTAALQAENLLETKVAVKDGSKPGVFILRLPSSYVYLAGSMTFKGGPLSVSFSDNDGLDWREIATVASGGEQRVDLGPHIFRRYDYRLKFELKGKGAGLESLRLTHDVQHSQRPLPALGQGKNAITFSAGPAEGTITVEGSTNREMKGKQLVFTDFHPEVNGIGEPNLFISGAKGDITFPVSTPGDIVRLRFGTHYRAREASDGWDYLVSFDGGKSWKGVDRAAGPTAGHCKYVTCADVPAGKRSALVRFAGTNRNATMIFNFRIDADYKEPHGGFRPVKVTYRWEEDGKPKENVFVARKPQEAYTITCASKPLMKSIALELAE